MTNPLPLTLYYINTTPLSTSPNPSLPLLTTLRPTDQTSITRFHRLQDRHMSLASTLLKYLFIHRTAKIPWSEIVISQTPPPHKRPFWDPATAPSHALGPHPGAARAVEFNVSHQAGLVALAGCATDTPPSTVLTTTTATTPDGHVLASSSPIDDGKPGPGPGPGRDPDGSPPLLGIDITCPFEPSRGTSNRITTPSQFNEWVDIFAEVFSKAEVEDMKSYVPPPSVPGGEAEGIAAKLRYFYTFWALKEAYIKMTGEALLAGWLRELEFRHVRVPAVAEEGRWGAVESGVQVWMQGRRIEGLRVEVVGFGSEYIVALVGRGLDGNGDGGGDSGGKGGLLLGEGMREVDIEGYLRDCAGERCGCLEKRDG